MTWDNETCFYEYQEGATYLLKKLGITQLDHIKTLEVLYPYYNQIIKYLNKELMCNCEDTIKAKIQKILDIADHGARLINTKEDQPIWDWDPEEVTEDVSDIVEQDFNMYEESGQPIKYTVNKTRTKPGVSFGENTKLIFNAPENKTIKITLDQNFLRSEDWYGQYIYIQEEITDLPNPTITWDKNTSVGTQYTSTTNTCVIWYYSDLIDQQQTQFFTVTVENNESEPPQPKEKTRTLELAEEVGIDYESDLYIQDRFVFSWADLLGTLCLRLKFQYAHLFKQEVDDTCGCNCGRGQTEEDYESWVSGVYPEDYEYDRTNYYRTNTNWGTTEDRICDCYKKNL